MDYNQNTNQAVPPAAPAPKSNNMLWAWIALAVVFAGFSLAFYYFLGSWRAPAPREQAGEEDVILQDLEGVNLGGLDSELSDIDKELAQ